MNLQSNCRSNYFAVKDRAAFFAWLELYNVHSIQAEDGKVGFVSLDGWPDRERSAEEKAQVSDDNAEYVELVEELAPHLAEGEIAIVMMVAHEGDRGYDGLAQAIGWDGHTEAISLADIYRKAANHYGIADSRISRAEY